MTGALAGIGEPKSRREIAAKQQLQLYTSIKACECYDMERNENTLADLIRAALDTREDEIEVLPSYENGEIERAKLALNCLEERFQSMIDERITQMLKELRP